MTPQKFIVRVSWLIAIGGLLAELIGLVKTLPAQAMPYLYKVAGIFRTVSLSFLNLTEYHNFDSHLVCNYANLLFCFLMALGVFLYTNSHQKEVRLLRFAFSILLLCNALSCIAIPFESITAFFQSPSLVWWLMWILYKIATVALVYFSWWALQQLGQSRELKQVHEGEQAWLVSASKKKRTFHLAVDTLLIMLVFYSYMDTYHRFLGQTVAGIFGDQLSLFVFLAIVRLLYYPFFETFLGSTPAKFLTETQVITTNGEKLTLKTSFLRTVSRFVPFEPFSFFSYTGWHDKWTETQVVEESQSGVSGTRYLWIIPMVILLGAGGYFGYEAYSDHLNYLDQKAEYDSRIIRFERQLATLSTSHYIRMKEAQEYSSKSLYLKVEEVGNETIVVRAIPSKDYEANIVGIDEFYLQHREEILKIQLSRSSLRNAFTKEYGKYSAYQRNTLKFPGDDTEYQIESIFVQSAPVLEASAGASLTGNELLLGFRNFGWGGKLISIHTIKGGIEWQMPLPTYIDGVEAGQYGGGAFSVRGTNYQYNTPYAFEFSVEDGKGHTYTYQVEGVNLNRTIRQIN